MTNQKAFIINTIGLITIVVGIIGSVVLGEVFPIKTLEGVYYSRLEESYNWYIAIIGTISSIISGVIFIGFAEIIDLLQQNVNNTAKLFTLKNHDVGFEYGELPEL